MFHCALFVLMLLNELIMVRSCPFVSTSVSSAKSIKHFFEMRYGESTLKVACQIAF
jgi:hypothetical protein